MLLINVPNVQRLYMLDDNADQVSDDWELGWDSYQGHSPEVYRALADWAIELGPVGGKEGGQIIFEGPPENLKKTRNSPTGQALKN
jgi:hypothetical protein